VGDEASSKHSKIQTLRSLIARSAGGAPGSAALRGARRRSAALRGAGCGRRTWERGPPGRGRGRRPTERRGVYPARTRARRSRALHNWERVPPGRGRVARPSGARARAAVNRTAGCTRHGLQGTGVGGEPGRALLRGARRAGARPSGARARAVANRTAGCTRYGLGARPSGAQDDGARPSGARARAAANRTAGCTRHGRGHAGAVPHITPARSGRCGQPNGGVPPARTRARRSRALHNACAPRAGGAPGSAALRDARRWSAARRGAGERAHPPSGWPGARTDGGAILPTSGVYSYENQYENNTKSNQGQRK